MCDCCQCPTLRKHTLPDYDEPGKFNRITMTSEDSIEWSNTDIISYQPNQAIQYLKAIKKSNLINYNKMKMLNELKLQF